MVLERQGAPLARREVASPAPGPGEVRVRIGACGVCRTDLHVVDGELPAHRLPLVPGHQAVGRVDALGPGCTLLRPGDRVGIPWLRHTCGHCAYCRSHRENLCPFSRYTGWDEDGGYAEEAVVPEAYAYPLPGPLEDAAVAPLLCAGIIGWRALKRAELPSGGRLGLYGFGSSAHVVLALARHLGHEVHIVSREARHRALALRLGAVSAGGAGEHPPVPLDAAIVFAPAGEVVEAALRAVGPGGTVVTAGITMTAIPALDYAACLFHERQLRSVEANTREDGRELLAAAAAARFTPEVTRFPLNQANEALRALREDRVAGTAVLDLAL
ncbi:MAG TPA: zinc-dependent alcohol dehydrogenase family protein [Candidatus Polarisedimenticolaceae bacterium]|nr:zinc-dependent alcohol dehydrogenase family protein [Candidatus Polarisedimenticolaceae bacterium]